MSPHRNKSLAMLAAALYYFPRLGGLAKTVLWMSAWISTGGARWLYLFYHTAKRDFR